MELSDNTTEILSNNYVYSSTMKAFDFIREECQKLLSCSDIMPML
jgi:hypothetical protein